jgi:hypothetical protein
MPKLINPDRRPTKKIILPSSTPDDEAWVEVYTEVLTGDLEQVGNVGDLKGLATVTGLVNLIKDWNFEDENGKKAEINIENLRRLKQIDSVAIVDEMSKIKAGEITDEAKKKTK